MTKPQSIVIPEEAVVTLIHAVQQMPWHAAEPVLRQYNNLVAQANPGFNPQINELKKELATQPQKAPNVPIKPKGKK